MSLTVVLTSGSHTRTEGKSVVRYMPRSRSYEGDPMVVSEGDYIQSFKGRSEIVDGELAVVEAVVKEEAPVAAPEDMPYYPEDLPAEEAPPSPSDTPPEISTLGWQDAVLTIKEVTDISTLEAIAVEEMGARNRKMVLRAIESQLKTLTIE